MTLMERIKSLFSGGSSTEDSHTGHDHSGNDHSHEPTTPTAPAEPAETESEDKPGY